LLLRGLLVLSCVTVVTLLAAELLLRAIYFSGPSRSEVGEGYQFDPELGWLPVPNAAAQQTTGNRPVLVKHNSLGLRERELSEIAPDRILLLGDSFTYGYDAEVNERFSELLQKELPQYGIVNAGVSGYGTDQQFLLMKRLWNHVNPKHVVLTFCVDNDRGHGGRCCPLALLFRRPLLVPLLHPWQILRLHDLFELRDHALVQHLLVRGAVHAETVLCRQPLESRAFTLSGLPLCVPRQTGSPVMTCARHRKTPKAWHTARGSGHVASTSPPTDRGGRCRFPARNRQPR
jgi:GDSL-like Lipase/Acylhydrolase family